MPLQGWAAPILSNNSGVGHWKPVLKKKISKPTLPPPPVLYDRSVITMCNPIKRWYARHFWVLLQAMFMNDWNQTAQRLKLQERLLIINKRNIIRWSIYRDNNFHSRRQVFKFFLKSWVLKLNVSVKSKLQHPPGQPPGHLTFLKIFVQISPYPGQNAVQMPNTRVHSGDQMPPPRGHFTGTKMTEGRQKRLQLSNKIFINITKTEKHC